MRKMEDEAEMRTEIGGKWKKRKNEDYSNKVKKK